MEQKHTTEPTVDDYSASDINFATARTVLKGVYYLVETVLGIALGIFIVRAVAVKDHLGIAAIPVLFGAMVVFHLLYSFLIGFFELIRHTRQIRDELALARCGRQAARGGGQGLTALPSGGAAESN